MTGQREKNPGARRGEADQPVEESAEVRQPVKEGETQPSPSTLPDGPQFELTGGEVCLDFANTVDSRPTPEAVELLNSYGWVSEADGTVHLPIERAMDLVAAEQP